MSQVSVNAGALQMVLNILERGTPVQQEAAAELKATVLTLPEWHKGVELPAMSGKYWVRLKDGHTRAMQVWLVKSKDVVRLDKQAYEGLRYTWDMVDRWHVLPDEEYEEPFDLDASQGTIEWD